MSEFKTHESAVTQFIDANGVRYAYRRIGKPGGVPLVFCHRFRGTMDDWDAAVVNGFAKEREVILFDNAGVGSSSGTVPSDIQSMSNHAIAFVKGLGLKQVDLIGFSMGGFVVQFAALTEPSLFRKLILAGTGPGAGEKAVPQGPEVRPVAGRPVLGLDEYLFLFFTPSEKSQAAGRAYWERLKLRSGELEPALPVEGVQAQVQALIRWNTADSAYNRLGDIKQPVLVANGSNDIMVRTPNSFVMSQLLPDATLILYPDAGHGFLFQYPELFVHHANTFLS